jgi:hypothetical protein
MNDDPAWPSPPSLHRMLYWGDAPGKRPHDHVRRDVPDVSRRGIIFVLQNGKDAHPDIQAKGWANCRICGAHLGTRDLTAFGFVWPEKAEHYVRSHGVWTPECDQLLQRVLATTARHP